ncbi:MAG: hypothetical protein QM804_17555 [Propionicimonas sp.]
MTSPEPTQPPVTGVPRIDQALAELELGDDVTTHPAALAAALDALQQALNQP